MTDGVTINAGSGGPTIATDDAGTPGHIQLFKLAYSADGSATLVPADANGLKVDSELPAAAALSDAQSRTASVPMVGAALLVDDGTNIGRARTVGAADGVAAPELLGVGLVGWDATNSVYRKATVNASSQLLAQVIGSGGIASDAGTATSALAVLPALYDGTTYGRQRGNTEGTVLASAARTATPTIANITNYNARGIRLFLNVTATPNNAETLTVSIEWVDPVSAAVKALTAFPAITATTLGAAPAAGSRELVFELYPGAVETAAVANHEVQGGSLPRTLHPKVTHSATGSWTYSLGYGFIL
jgi:hypothetical protein